MPKKKKTFTMGRYIRSTEESAASRWCIANDMLITPRQAAWGVNEWYIDIEQGKYPNRKLLGTSPETYGPGEIWKKIAKYQKYYYDKYK